MPAWTDVYPLPPEGIVKDHVYIKRSVQQKDGVYVTTYPALYHRVRCYWSYALDLYLPIINGL